RARKWACRHQPVVWSVAVSAAVLTALAMIGLMVSNVLARRAEREAKYSLFEARLAQARASRYSRQVGQRLESWKALTKAAALAGELALGEERLLELRNEAIACLALPDLRRVKGPWQGSPTGGPWHVEFDADLKRYSRQ